MIFEQIFKRVPLGYSKSEYGCRVQNAAAVSGGKITTLYGGIPIVVNGQIIGAFGVGGATGEQDALIAKAGADALLAALGKK